MLDDTCCQVQLSIILRRVQEKRRTIGIENAVLLCFYVMVFTLDAVAGLHRVTIAFCFYFFKHT